MRSVHVVCAAWLCVLLALCRASPVRDATAQARNSRQMKDASMTMAQAEMNIFATPAAAAKATNETPFGQLSNYAGLLFSGYPGLLGNAVGAPLSTGMPISAPNVVTSPAALGALPPTNAAAALPGNFASFPGFGGNNNSNFGNPFNPYSSSVNGMFPANLYGGSNFPPAATPPLQSLQGQFASLEQLVNMANLQGLNWPQFPSSPTGPYAIGGPSSIRAPAPFAAFAPPLLPPGYYTQTRYGPAF